MSTSIFIIILSLDCKTVGFFSKSVKEIGTAWRKSLTRPWGLWGERKKRLSPVSQSVFSLVPEFPDLLFDCSRVLEYAKIRTVLQSILSWKKRYFHGEFSWIKLRKNIMTSACKNGLLWIMNLEIKFIYCNVYVILLKG